VPLEIDPATRHVVGLTLAPGRVEATRLSLRGQVFGSPAAKTVAQSRQVVAAARELLRRTVNRQTLAVGVSVPGFIDLNAHELLFSSATPGLGPVSLAGLYEQAGDLPVALGNDMYAAGVRWVLTHRTDENQDVLLVGIEDGELGATLLVSGRSNRGCVAAANELGHTRFFTDTERCYCGQVGCLERICSSDFLVRNGAPVGTRLADRARLYEGDDGPLEVMVRHLAMGLANATNFVRPDCLVLAGRLSRFRGFMDLISRSVRGLLLSELADRVRISFWDEAVGGSAETAGWLALAGLYSTTWGPAQGRPIMSPGTGRWS
jgi:glucokinase